MSESAYLHDDEMAASARAAEVVVPLVLELAGPISSVVDVGGGIGTWLSVFARQGVQRVLLVDVPEVAPHLLVDRSCFQPANLNARFPELPRCDLAVCVECAEHLNPDRSAPLVECLTSSADIVLFSAAIPAQPGKHHVNLEPPAYWAKLFAAREFLRYDILRQRIVNDPAVAWWYRQNLYLFAKSSVSRFAGQTDFLPDDFEIVYRDILQSHRAASDRAARDHAAGERAIKRRPKYSLRRMFGHRTIG